MSDPVEIVIVENMSDSEGNKNSSVSNHRTRLGSRNVTDIVKSLKPALQEYLSEMVKHANVEITSVHESYNYEPIVDKNRAWNCMGVFYDYLIRKEIHNLKNENAYDSRAERGELFEDSYPTPIDNLLLSYEIFKDKKKPTFNILEDIYNTAMLHMVFFLNKFTPFDSQMVNEQNIMSILRYVETLDLDNILINPVVGNDYFKADADLILNDKIFDIKTSKFKSLKRANQEISKKEFYQLIFYALGLYINEQREIRKFLIYNPLLGYEYLMEVPNLNFQEFLDLVKEQSPI